MNKVYEGCLDFDDTVRDELTNCTDIWLLSHKTHHVFNLRLCFVPWRDKRESSLEYCIPSAPRKRPHRSIVQVALTVRLIFMFWLGQTNTGLSLMRPAFVSPCESKSQLSLFKINRLLRSLVRFHTYSLFALVQIRWWVCKVGVIFPGFALVSHLEKSKRTKMHHSKSRKNVHSSYWSDVSRAEQES